VNTQISIPRSTARWVALGVGIVALIVGAILFFIAPLSTGESATTFKTISYVALGLGVAGLVGFVLLDPQTLVEAITGRSGQYTLTTWLMALFFTAFVIAIFVILKQAAIPPWDLTSAGKYQMTDTTRKLLESLKPDVKVHVIGFYVAGQDPDYADAQLWLKQYASVSNGKITYEFVDPDKNPGLAQQDGMSRSSTMVFKSGNQKAEASTATEQDMTNALLHVLSGETRNVYIVTGNGEKSTQSFDQTGISQLQTLLTNANFKVTDLNLLSQNAIPADANVVIIPGPQTGYLKGEVDALNAYQDKGGGLIEMVDALTLTSDDPLLTNLKSRWGITANDDIVVDVVTQSFSDALTPVIFDFDDNSPITQGMTAGGRRILMSTARSYNIAQPNPANITLDPFLLTPGQGGSWGEHNYTGEQPNLQYSPGVDQPGPLNVGVSGDNTQNKSRIVVFGDSDMVTNQVLSLDKYNGDLLLNAVNWASHKEDLISLPAPVDATRAEDKLTSLPLFVVIAVSSVCLIPLVLIVSGIVVWSVRRRRR